MEPVAQIPGAPAPLRLRPPLGPAQTEDCDVGRPLRGNRSRTNVRNDKKIRVGPRPRPRTPQYDEDARDSAKPALGEVDLEYGGTKAARPLDLAVRFCYIT
jgi:hypothetical protein